MRLLKSASSVLAFLVVAGCSSGAVPTPIIIYVTPPPTASQAVVEAVPSPTASPFPSAEPTVRVTPTPTPKPKPTPTPKPWYGEGYELIQVDPPIAFRWLKSSEFDCSYSGASCWGMYVIPKLGCSSLYVELSIEDRNGTVIGATNDAVGAVGARQRAKLIFDTFDEAAQTARISDLSCY